MNWVQANAGFIVGKAWDASIARLRQDLSCWVAWESGQFDEIDAFIEEAKKKLRALEEGMSVEDAVLEPVVASRDEHRETWRDLPEFKWMLNLFSEVLELEEALRGEHEHDPDWELTQIAAICLNWLAMRRAK